MKNKTATDKNNIYALFIQELKAILHNKAVMLSTLGAIVMYSVLYPLPYLNQSSVNTHIIAIDRSKSPESRILLQYINSTPQVKIIQHTESVLKAKESITQHPEIRGYIYIPKTFHKDILDNVQAKVIFAGDATSFMTYSAIATGILNAGKYFAGTKKIKDSVLSGTTLQYAQYTVQPFKSEFIPTFNISQNYLQYVLPAVMILILQQTLLMGFSIRTADCTNPHTGTSWILRSGAFLVLYSLFTFYFFGGILSVYSIPTNIQSPFAMIWGSGLFLCASLALAFFINQLPLRLEIILISIVLSSMPLLFSASFIWPTSHIPQPVLWIANIFPSTVAIPGLLSINQMGAYITETKNMQFILLLQTAIYTALGILMHKKCRKRIL